MSCTEKKTRLVIWFLGFATRQDANGKSSPHGALMLMNPMDSNPIKNHQQKQIQETTILTSYDWKTNNQDCDLPNTHSPSRITALPNTNPPLDHKTMKHEGFNP